MEKIISPVHINYVNKDSLPKTYNVYVKIEFKNGRLSLSGVGGPLKNGHCIGGCGQNLEEIASGTPNNDWTTEMVKKLLDIWNEWHLNDVCAYCKHQKQLGWRELAQKEVEIYHFQLTSKAIEIRRKAKEELPCNLTKEEIKVLNLDFALTHHEPNLPESIAKYYEPKRSYNGINNGVEKKLLGWLRPSDHPDGILCKPCPVCGYKYGTKWLKEDVPDDVIQWLFALPAAKVKPKYI